MFSKSVKLLSLFVLLFVVTVQSHEQTQCVLPLPRYAFFAPLIFHNNGSLISTENVGDLVQDITIPTGMKVILSCAPNFFKNSPNDNVLEATCKSEKTLVINNMEKNFLKDLACEVRAVEEILVPVDGCPSDAESIEYGYTNPIKEKSYVLGEACYSKSQGKTIFVHTKVPSAVRSINVHLKTENQDYFKQKHPDSKYKIDFLMASRLDTLNERLTGKLGKSKIPFLEPRNFINLKLLPNKQFQSVLRLGWNYAVANGYEHAPNLDLLQSDILSLNSKNVNMYIGSHGVLALKDSKGAYTDIYLRDEDDEKVYPVPKFIWTVVKVENKIAAFAIYNNPEASEKDIERESFCQNKCSQMTWLRNLLQNESYNNFKGGYVLCCSFDEFTKQVQEMPKIQGEFELLV